MHETIGCFLIHFRNFAHFFCNVSMISTLHDMSRTFMILQLCRLGSWDLQGAAHGARRQTYGLVRRPSRLQYHTRLLTNQTLLSSCVHYGTPQKEAGRAHQSWA